MTNDDEWCPACRCRARSTSSPRNPGRAATRWRPDVVQARGRRFDTCRPPHRSAATLIRRPSTSIQCHSMSSYAIVPVGVERACARPRPHGRATGTLSRGRSALLTANAGPSIRGHPTAREAMSRRSEVLGIGAQLVDEHHDDRLLRRHLPAHRAVADQAAAMAQGEGLPVRQRALDAEAVPVVAAVVRAWCAHVGQQVGGKQLPPNRALVKRTMSGAVDTTAPAA